MTTRRFRYALEALLRKRRSDWRTVKGEEMAAGRVVDDRRAEVDRAQGGVAGTEQLLRQARRGGSAIDPEQQHLLGNYLAHQRLVLAERCAALARAREVRERISANLADISRGIKSLEKHRARREADHRAAEGRREEHVLDELWLLGRARRRETD
ncbi:MAG TPA: hypothetical protein VNK48_11510 [Xanthobacteraceae bacterium]|nr:hypothetical protein [Xanthobacteraceae bacterium]